MNITHAALAILLASPASAQSAAQQQALKLDADLVRTMTDAVFLSLTGRAVGDDAAPAPDATASADGPDSRLSRPRALSMMYETLASYEYAQADGGGKPQEAGAKLGSRKSSLANRKASSALERVRSRLHASKAAPVESGRSVAVGNRRLAALNKTVGDLNAQLQDPAATPAAKAALHAKIGKVYDQMSAAARYQASVSVVTGSVLDDDGAAAAAPAAPSAPAATDSNQVARKSAKAAKAAKPAARAKAKIADDAAPAASDAPAPSDDDAAAAGTSELNDMSSKMHDRIQTTKFEDPKTK